MNVYGTSQQIKEIRTYEISFIEIQLPYMIGMSEQAISSLKLPPLENATGPDKYLFDFADAIQKAPASPPVIIKEITASPSTAAENALFFLQQRVGHPSVDVDSSARIGSNSDQGITLESGKLAARPVDISEVLRNRNYAPVLVHDGYLIKYIYKFDGRGRVSLDNTEQVIQNGIFGNPSTTDMTYLKIDGAGIAGNELMDHDVKKSSRVRLFIDPDKLAQSRSVFSDPEPFYSRLEGDVIGQSYFVLGGIPAEAIIGIANQNGLIMINRSKVDESQL